MNIGGRSQEVLSRRRLIAVTGGLAGAAIVGSLWPEGVASAAGAAEDPPTGAADAARAGTGRVYSGDFPDPFVLRVGKRFYAYATQTGSTNVQVMRSRDLSRWSAPHEALPRLPRWAGWGHTWAPAVLSRPHAYVLYYTLRHRASGRQCISVATSPRPEGPFADLSSSPFIFQHERGGSIDASPFVDDDGSAYLLWKSDDNAFGRATSIWGAPLRPDGLALAGAPVVLLSQDAAWEAPVIEAPALIHIDRTYYLFYGGGWWESDQAAIGYATADGPLGPYQKVTREEPWLSSRADASGPGGAEFFTDGAGGLQMAYHAWEPGRIGYARGGERSLWIDPVVFTDGIPVWRRSHRRDGLTTVRPMKPE